MAVEIKREKDKTYDVDICLQLTESPFTDAYAFTSFEPWNITITPPTLPDGPAVDRLYGLHWDTGHPIFWGYNVAIDSVTTPALGSSGGGNNCAANYLGVRLTFSVLTDDDAYIVWGGHLAAPSDRLPAGLPNLTVPQDGGASNMTGVFQSRLQGAGDKTINFKSGDIEEQADLQFSKTVTTIDCICPGQTTLTIPAGSAVKYCFEINNTGTTPLLNVTLVDPVLGGDLTALLVGDFIDDDGIGGENDLAVRGTAVAQLPFSPILENTTNIAEVSGSELTKTDTATIFVYSIKVDVDKKVSSDGQSFVDGPIELMSGQDVWWRITMTNASSVAVDISLLDILDGDIIDLNNACAEKPVPSALSANGGQYTCTIGPDAAQGGTITNTITLEACDQIVSTSCVRVKDDASYRAVDLSINLVKEISTTGNPPWQKSVEVLVGTPLYYRFTVENTGESPFFGVVVTDPLLSQMPDNIICTIGLLDVGAVDFCSFGPILADFTGKNTPRQNTAKAQGCYQESCVYSEDDAYYTSLYWSHPPDFWKEHISNKSNVWLLSDYRPKTPLYRVFTTACRVYPSFKDLTLYEGLCFPTDGEAAEQLLREGVAALLNASFHENQQGDIFGPNDLVYFPLYSTATECLNRGHAASFCKDNNVVDLVNSTLTGDESGMVAMAAMLAAYNNGFSDLP